MNVHESAPKVPVTKTSLLEGEELFREVERVVFGDDLTANTDERLKAAFVRVPFHLWEEVVDTRLWESYTWPGFEQAIKAWNNREGKRWQEEIEAHVQSWRAKPRDFSNLNLCFEVLVPRMDTFYLDREGHEWIVPCNESRLDTVLGQRSQEIIKCSDPATAICRAAIAACQEKSE